MRHTKKKIRRRERSERDEVETLSVLDIIQFKPVMLHDEMLRVIVFPEKLSLGVIKEEL